MSKTLIHSIDAHIHAVSFAQKIYPFADLIKKMDKANVAKSVIFGLPVIRKSERVKTRNKTKHYYYPSTDTYIAEEYENLPEALKRRFTPLICGFDPTDPNSVYYIEALLKRFSFFRGVGEILFEHGSLTKTLVAERPKLTHPAMLKIFEICDKRSLPILVHQNVGPVKKGSKYGYLQSLEEVLQLFPNLTLIWAHAGIAKKVEHFNHHEVVRSLLEKYRNLHIDLSWDVFELVILDKNNQVTDEWVDLVSSYSDRFMIGSDICGHYKFLGKKMSRYNNLLEKLDTEAMENVAYRNADRIYFGK